MIARCIEREGKKARFAIYDTDKQNAPIEYFMDAETVSAAKATYLTPVNIGGKVISAPMPYSTSSHIAALIGYGCERVFFNV